MKTSELLYCFSKILNKKKYKFRFYLTWKYEEQNASILEKNNLNTCYVSFSKMNHYPLPRRTRQPDAFVSFVNIIPSAITFVMKEILDFYCTILLGNSGSFPSAAIKTLFPNTAHTFWYAIK